jgi:hypothetical protein
VLRLGFHLRRLSQSEECGILGEGVTVSSQGKSAVTILSPKFVDLEGAEAE